MTNRSQPCAMVVGGGIGGLAAALALVHHGVHIVMLEQASQLGEIGAGLQLGPNAFAALDALGVGEAVRDQAVYTDSLVLMDAVDATEVVNVPVGAAFRQRFGNPYAVSHRADLHDALLTTVRAHPLVTLHTGCAVSEVTVRPDGASVRTRDGREFGADALIGCDGVKSVVRQTLVGDEVRVSGHVVYRAVVPKDDMPADLRINSPVVWAAPKGHLVHYPLRGGEQYNLVLTFHSREREVWGVSQGSHAEVARYFTQIHPRPRQLLHLPSSWKRWSTADRDPVERWGRDCATLLGDAAHPMMQYLAQGACMALEDAVTLGAAYAACAGDWAAAMRRYEAARIARTARVVLSVREMGRIYHAAGVERLVRNSLWTGRTPERFYDSVEWLYGWRAQTALG